ncbi:MAG: hypothetical protein R3228_05235 [Halioglobus sp.]|nr:hypothetical protein [Halioglobus sp.]
MIGRGIVFYRRGLYALYALLLLLACWAIDLTSGATSPAGGDSWQGYTLGGVAALLLIWLAALGIRKRRYESGGNVVAWVSAHIFMGIALVGIATLHSGDRLDFNVHVLGYVLLLVVVASGVVGLVLYLALPGSGLNNRKGVRRADMIDELHELNKESLARAEHCSPAAQLAVRSAIEGTAIGGGLWSRLFAVDRSTFLQPGDLGDLEAARSVPNRGQESVLDYIAQYAPRVRAQDEADALSKLVALIARRQHLLGRIRRDVQGQAWLGFWRYLHLVLSVALVTVLIVHVIVVFMY